MSTNTNNRGMSFTNAIASILCIGMLGVVVIPGLSELKQRVEPTICSNNLKSCVQGWNLYASVSNGKWPAIWDGGYAGSSSIFTQVPYIMWHFVKGEVPGEFSTLNFNVRQSDNPVYHCPTTAKATDWESPFPRGLTSYTQAWYSVYDDVFLARWESPMDHYPEPELFTHSSATFLIGDLAGLSQERYYNGWTRYGSFKAYSPHDGKGNYAFCDGHVELLTTEEFLAKGDQTFKPYLTGQEGSE